MNAETSRVFWFARSSGHLLQWGRVLMNAETIRLTITGPPRTKKLQWGRVLMNAEKAAGSGLADLVHAPPSCTRKRRGSCVTGEPTDESLHGHQRTS